MFLIFGFKSMLKNLAMVTTVCPTCGNPAAHRIVKRTRMFTLFFIPLIPIGIKHYSVCSLCGTTTQLDKASVQSALAAAAAAGPATVPVEPSPQIAPPSDGSIDSSHGSGGSAGS